MLDANLNSLSAQLAQMTPQQRQQYAAMHKNDPNAAMVLSLAKFITDTENAQRQRMLTQQMAASQPVAQKPVADQVIAGLAALPAPNMEGIPDGGIAGFEEEAPAPVHHHRGYAGGGGVWPMGDDISQFMDDGEPSPQTVRRRTKLDAERDANMARARAQGENLRPTMVGDPRVLGPTPPIPQAPVQEAAPTAPEPAAAPSGGIAGLGPAPSMPSLGGIPLLDPNAVQRSDVEGNYRKLTAGDAAQLEQMRAQTEELGKSRVKAAEGEMADVKRDQDELGVYGQDREKRLKAREGRLDKQTSDNKAMSIINAGLAMMSGDSPYAMVNIGKGAAVGTKQYTEGLEKIEAAREKLDDAFAQLDDIRRREKKDNSKELREAKGKVTAAIHAGMEDLMKHTEKVFGVNRKDQELIYGAQIKEDSDVRHLRQDALKTNVQSQVQMRGQDASLAGTKYAADSSVRAAGIRAAAYGGAGGKNMPVQIARLIESTRSNIERQAKDFATQYQKENFRAPSQAMMQKFIAQKTAEARKLNPSLAEWMSSPEDDVATPTGPDMSQFKVVR
jgi:hypothetical protein